MVFLQQNAEWMSAVAIMFFTAFQVWLHFAQIRQELILKRVELAQKLDDACKEFPETYDMTEKAILFLKSNQSLFVSLLNSKDRSKYANLMVFLMNLKKIKECPKEMIFDHVKEFYDKVFELNIVLCNARYGLVKHEKVKNENKKN